MFKFAKILNDKTFEVSVVKDIADDEFIKINKYELLDVQQSDVDNNWYLAEKCPMKTDEEKAELVRQERISEIKEELVAIDLKRIRAMCEPSSKTTSQSWLEYYNEQARTLRKELQTLGVSE